MNTNELLEAALFYAQRLNWSIFPLKPKEKQPATPHGVTDASKDPDVVRAWWQRTPTANIGLATGEIVVLDFDAHKPGYGGADLLTLLTEEYPTVTADTPSGGVHLLFAARPGLRLTNARGLLPKGVDVRGHGGYIVVAPSVFARNGTSGAWRWRTGREPWAVQPAPLPLLVVDLILAANEVNRVESRPAGKKANADDTDDVIAEFNRTHKIAEILTAHGYQIGRAGGGLTRLRRPGGGSLSVVVSTISGVERSYHHSTSDDLHTDRHARDAFDVWTQLEHGGDAGQAYKAAKRAQGKWTEKPPKAAKPTPTPAKAAPTKDASASFDGGRHDLGNAQFALDRHAGKFAYSDSLGWLYHTGTRWSIETAEAQVHAAMVDTLKARCALALQQNDLDLLKAAAPTAKHTRDAIYHFKHMVTVSTSEFDSEKHLLNCKNGVVNLRTGELVTHSPSDRFTYCVETDYKPGETSELWEELLLDWFNQDHEVMLYLQRAMGYTITGESKEECLFYLQGPGRSGKGTLANTVAGLLGAPLAQGVQFDAFTDGGDSQNFRLAPLRAARMVTASEKRKGERLNEALVKQVTGRDAIQAAHKYGQPFTFTPQFKLWFMSNDMPRGDVDDDAFWYRVRLFALTKSYMGSEDNGIKDTLTQRGNREGVLAWLVYGAMRYYAKGLGTPARIITNAQTARDEQDHVLQWLLDRCEAKEGIETLTGDLYASYSEWCNEAGIDKAKLSKMGLTKKLEKKGYPVRRTTLKGSQVTLAYGVGII
jgi:putative DNA primase/helicase